MGTFMLVVISLALLAGVTLYFIEHKKRTAPFHGTKSEDGRVHDEVI